MAIRSSFFNSVNGDRRYLAYNFAEYFASFIGNGVFANPSNAFQVYDKENMIVNVKAGKAWINGYIAVNDGDYNLTITNADGVLNRIDRIVLRLDFNVRAINIAVKKGAFASTPVAPTLQRDAEVYELVLADVYVGKGITRITQSNITDQRMNKALCGVVKGTVDQIDTTDLFNQYGSAFQEWFETVKNYLNDTAVGNVANKLAEHTLEGNAHGIGDKKTLLTAQKTTLVDSINELADYVRTPGYGVATGTNAYAVTLNPAPIAYKDGMGLVVKINTASTGATTINVNGLGAKPILKANGAPVSDLKAGAVYSIRYNGMAFILQGEGGDEKAIKTLLYNQTFNTTFGRLTYVDNDVLCYINSRICYKVSKTTGTLLKTIDTSSLQTSSWTLRSYTPDGFVLGNSGYTLYVYDELSTLLYSLPSSAYGGVHFYIANYGFYSTAYYNGNSISIGISRFNASQTYVGELYQLNVTSSSIINSVPLTVVKKQSGELHFVLNTTVNDLEYFRDILLTIATASKITDTTLANFKAISSAATKNLSSISVQEGWKQ